MPLVCSVTGRRRYDYRHRGDSALASTLVCATAGILRGPQDTTSSGAGYCSAGWACVTFAVDLVAYKLSESLLDRLPLILARCSARCPSWQKSLLAGAAYFVIVFIAAFALGAARVTFVVPAVGSLWATLLELPLTSVASWIVCGWLVRIYGIRSLRQAIGMGVTAFVMLMGTEAAGSILLFNRSLADHIGSYATAAGGLGLAGQIAFGLFPVIRYIRNTTVPARTDVPID